MGVVLGAVAAGVAVWVVAGSSVAQDDYDALAASLAATEGDLDATVDELASVSELLAAEREQSAELTAELSDTESTVAAVEQTLAQVRADVEVLTASERELEDRLAAVAALARLVGYVNLDWIPEDAEALASQGFDPSTPDAILDALGEDSSWLEWVGSTAAGRTYYRTISVIDDPELSASFDRFLASDVGSTEELFAWNEFNFRMIELLVGLAVDQTSEADTSGGELGTEVSSECAAVVRTYQVAIEAWYALNGDGSHPSGEDLVDEGVLRSYDATDVEVVQGSGEQRSIARPTDACAEATATA